MPAPTQFLKRISNRNKISRLFERSSKCSLTPSQGNVLAQDVCSASITPSFQEDRGLAVFETLGSVSSANLLSVAEPQLDWVVSWI